MESESKLLEKNDTNLLERNDIGGRLKSALSKEKLETVAERAKYAGTRRVRFYIDGEDDRGDKVSAKEKAVSAWNDVRVPLVGGCIGYIPRFACVYYLSFFSMVLSVYLVGAVMIGSPYLVYLGLFVVFHVPLCCCAVVLMSYTAVNACISTWWAHGFGVILYSACFAFSCLPPICCFLFVLIQAPLCTEWVNGWVVIGCVGHQVLLWASIAGFCAVTYGLLIQCCWAGLSAVESVRDAKSLVLNELKHDEVKMRTDEENLWENNKDITLEKNTESIDNSYVVSDSLDDTNVVSDNLDNLNGFDDEKKKKKKKKKVKKIDTIPVEQTNEELPSLDQNLSLQGW